jgi:propanol-preferring alcohol dehydrogenase
MTSAERAMILVRQGEPLVLRAFEAGRPGAGEVLVRVHACGVCRTDLHVVDGDLKESRLPLVIGHQIAGVVESVGEGVEGLAVGDRVGVPWLGWTCGVCRFCVSGRENLCVRPLFTGYTRNGGYADRAIADARYCLPIPPGFDDISAAPLLCAGLIGYRAWRMIGDAEVVALYGFGSAAHIIAQVGIHEGRKVLAYTRPGDAAGQAFARFLGVTWAGGVGEAPPERPQAAIIFAPAGELVPQALRDVDRGGVVVCAGIHMSDIPSFPYEILWEERQLRSVANLTRADGVGFLELAARVPVRTEVTVYPLERANEALDDLRAGRIEGSAVIALR